MLWVSRYCGSSDYLSVLPAASYRATQMGLELAVGNQLEMEMVVGDLRRTYPVEIDGAAGAVAAEFSMTGGRGYTPITIRGLAIHHGWLLQRMDGDEWATVDQAVYGNDYWQTHYDDRTSSYALTYNVPNRGAHRYRLAWRPE